MFAYFSAQKIVQDQDFLVKYTALAWNKENDLLLVGRSDGLAFLRNMEPKLRVPVRNTGAALQSTDARKRSEDQDLINHKMEIRIVAWNAKHDVVATGDIGGIVTVWRLDEKTGIWENFMATRAVQVAVLGMEWTKDGDCICIVYENGSVMVGKIDGMKMWSVELKHARIPAWSPDGSVLLVGTSLGQIFIYDKGSNNTGFVALTKKPDERPSERPLIDMKWWGAGEGSSATLSRLAVAFEDGKCFLLSGETDPCPLAFNVPMAIICMEWSADGKLLAFGGRSRITAAKPDGTIQLMIYSTLGRLEYLMRLDTHKKISSLSWDSTGGRLALLLDDQLSFLTVKHPLKYCFFENLLTYSCSRDDNPDALLVLYNCKTERKITVKHYPGQRIVSVSAGTDFCVAAARVIKEAGQYNIYIINETGATVNVVSASIEPTFLTANENQIIVASKEVLFVWSFRQSGNVDIVSSRYETNERYFHIDDSHGFIDVKLKRPRLFEVSADPICAISTSRDVLVVARESGNVVRYRLPQMGWEREYSSILPKPKKLGLNKDSSRLLVINHDGQCCMYVLSETKLAKDAAPVKDVKLNLERNDIWDFMWAEDDAEMFIVAQRNSAIVYRNRDPEEPVANEGYFCQFKNLEIRVAYVDEIIRSATPTEPPNQSSKVLRVKSLRETYHLMETTSLAEAQRFVDMHPHPVLWNLIGDKALQRLQLDLAEVCYIHGENYRGVQFVNRLRKQKSDGVRQAEMSARFGDMYRAEQEFIGAGRADLAYDMRRISGDWFRLKELAEEDQNEVALKNAHEGLGKYYFDRQSWDDATKNFDRARDYAALYKCHVISGDVDKLEELAEQLPPAHPLLVDIGQLLGRYGHSKAASKILRKADQPELALKLSLANHDFTSAGEIARSVDIDGFSPKAVTTLMTKAIEKQIASQPGTSTTALWDASKLYYNAGSYLEAAKCLFQLLELESDRSQPDYLRLKKIAVLAASAVEEARTGTQRKGMGDKRMLIEEDTFSTDHAFLDDPWRAAEAYNVMIVAQTYFVQGDYARALRAAGTLCVFIDILDSVQVFSLIALASASLQRWDMVNEAIMRLVSMDTTPPDVVQEMERFADDLFTKFSPNDVDKDVPLPTPLCMKCKERISIWDVRCEGCGTKYPLCMATGSPVTETEVWQCDFCHHHCAASAIRARRVCPLCHVTRK